MTHWYIPAKPKSVAYIATPPVNWPDEEQTELLRLREVEGLSWDKVAERLKRSQPSVESKYKYLKSKAAREGHPDVEARVSPEALRERAKRLHAPPRDLTGAFFGDPPVGYSQLDRR